MSGSERRVKRHVPHLPPLLLFEDSRAAQRQWRRGGRWVRNRVFTVTPLRFASNMFRLSKTRPEGGERRQTDGFLRARAPEPDEQSHRLNRGRSPPKALCSISAALGCNCSSKGSDAQKPAGHPDVSPALPPVVKVFNGLRPAGPQRRGGSAGTSAIFTLIERRAKPTDGAPFNPGK